MERLPPQEPCRNQPFHDLQANIAGQRPQYVKLPGQRLMARDFDRQVAAFQVRVAVLNGYTMRGISVTQIAGQICPAKGAVPPSTDLCNRAG